MRSVSRARRRARPSCCWSKTATTSPTTASTNIADVPPTGWPGNWQRRAAYLSHGASRSIRLRRVGILLWRILQGVNELFPLFVVEPIHVRHEHTKELTPARTSRRLFHALN